MEEPTVPCKISHFTENLTSE